MSGRALAALLLVLCAGGAVVDAEPTPRARRGWDYVVEPSADLSTIRVTVCFRRFVPRRLVLNQAGARQALRYAAGDDGGTLQDETSGDGVIPKGLVPGGCVSYDVDVDPLVRGWRGWKASRVGRDLLLQPGLFLLRPAVWPESVYVTVRFVCPGGLSVVTPWPQIAGSSEPDHHAITQRSLALDGTVAFGRFDVRTVNAAGSTFDVAQLDRDTDTTHEDVVTWLSAAAQAVARLYGRFPVPRAQIVVQPSRRSRTPVSFGTAMRPDGATVVFYVAANASAPAMVGEWVGVHELLHLGMPWTFRSEAWFQEGFVTYYQEVMRARAGFTTPEEAWAQLVGGFRRGASSGAGPTLETASRDMHETHSYWRVYWGGAAIALEIDLELRRLWPGKRSLDDVMRFLYARHGKDRKTPQMAMDMMAEVDRWLGRAVCVPIVQRALARNQQPNVSTTLAALGIEVLEDSVELDPAAPRAADALAIMRDP